MIDSFSLSLIRLDWRTSQDEREAGWWAFVLESDFKPELFVLGSFCCLSICFIKVPGFFLPQQSTLSQSSRPSFPNTQKKRKMKKPCSELNMAKRNWKAMEASRTVKAANIHVSPKRAINPMVVSITRMTVCCFDLSLLTICFLACLMSTLITTTKMTMLKSRMAKMGPRKAPKNTPVLPMKQLEDRKWVDNGQV